MITTRLVLSVLKPFGMANYVMICLSIGLLVLLNLLATMLVAVQIGAYAALAISAAAVLVSLAFAWGSLRHHRRRINLALRQGKFPELEFMHLSGLIIAALLMTIPGLVTTALAWVVYFSPLRLAVGSVMVHRYHQEFVNAYQHLQAGKL